MRYRSIFLSILLILLTVISYAQDPLPHIAVIPFSPINVSESDAEAITGLFETALVNTGAYRVIEQTQMHEILKVQEFSMSDCTSEECAVEIGQLLSAEQIILGSLASIGGKYILNAKIVDVAKAINLKADKVERPSLSDMTDGAEVLAYKLAGLTFRGEAEEEMVEGFGEIFVQTDPPGAEVYVNGVNKGVSPNLVTKVPLGFARIECRKGNLYAMEEVRITRSASTLSLKLSEQFGSLYIRSSTSAVEVVVGGETFGPLGSGLIERVPVGRHQVELHGQGLYWTDEVSIQLGVITQIAAVPSACGSISYSLPPGVSAEINGESFQQVVEGTGTLPHVWEGRYSIETASEIYEPYLAQFMVGQGKDLTITPKLFHNKEYEYQQFSRVLEDMERQLSGISNIGQEDIDRLVNLKSEIQSARNQHPELVAKSEFLLSKANEKLIRQEKRVQMSALTQRQNAIESRLNRMEPSHKVRNLGKWVSFGTGVVSLGTSVVLIFMADKAYEEYLNATITSEVIRYRDKVDMCKTYMYVGLGVGGAGLGSSLVLWFTQLREKRYQTELAEVESDIQDLQGQLE